MKAYVPREQYLARQGPNPYAARGVSQEHIDEWKEMREFGAVYDLDENSSRPATLEEVAYYEAGLIPHIDDVLIAEEPDELWAIKAAQGVKEACVNNR